MTEQTQALQEAIAEEGKNFSQCYLWLQKSMPEIFYQEVSKEEFSLIVHALMTFDRQNFTSEIHLKQATIALALESPQADIRILKNRALHAITNYTAYVSLVPLPKAHAHLRMVMIRFKKPQDEHKFSLEKKNHPYLSESKLEELLQKAQTSDLCQYEMQKGGKKEACSMHVTIAWKNIPKYHFLYRLANLVYRHCLVIDRLSISYINDYQKEGITLLSLELKNPGANVTCDVEDFLQELVLLKYFGSCDIFDETFVQPKLMRENLAHLLRTMRYFIHQMLLHVDPNLYSLLHIEEDLCRHPELTTKLLEAFEYKFDPKKVDMGTYEALKKEFVDLVNQIDTGDELLDRRRKNTLFQALNFVQSILKTNFYVKNKTALAFRLEGTVLERVPFDRKNNFPELPYGIFFIKGMHFFGFHIRFRDLARGGLRTVCPDGHERVMAEMNSVFQECYHLAFTQQKKNKDIPEGGAKGIIFLKPNVDLEHEDNMFVHELKEAGFSQELIAKKSDEFKKEQKSEYLYETQRSFVRSLLSLINCDADGKIREPSIIDYLQRPEYIYLGPDENLHDVMIDWIASESKRVDYRPKGAFISGKPALGINHKEYGVTSLGVMVFMHETLKFLRVDPFKDPFTVKMTGGPDGDVAGNMIDNFFRYYAKTAKLLALTDVSGTIYDPIGLDLEECHRLFKEGKSIRHYPPEKLNIGGFLLDREKRKELSAYSFQTLLWKNVSGQLISEWLSDNEMNALYRHNVHSVKTDIFLPCGGRPRTLNEENAAEFLDENSIPTSKVIVEGANLYLTQKARRFLEARGVFVVKDSSANKGGVITSSFEILAGLNLTEEEFAKHKIELVKEILERVKQCSYNEAILLLQTYQETNNFLTDISEEISYRINLYTDQILHHLESIKLSDDPKDPLVATFLSYAPELLRKKYEKKLLTQVPDNHKKAIIATALASKLVYQKGLNWAPSIVDVLPLIYI